MRQTLLGGLAFALIASTSLFAQDGPDSHPIDGATIAPPSAAAVEASHSAASKPAKQAHPMKVQGSVVSIDEPAHTVTVHPTSGPDVTLKVADSTKYYLGKKIGKYSDLRVGSHVSFEYSAENALNSASKVWVTNSVTVPPPSR